MSNRPLEFLPETAAIRFGVGLRQDKALPQSVTEMLKTLAGTDDMATAYPVPKFEAQLKVLSEIGRLQKIKRKQRGTQAGKVADKGIRKLKQQARRDQGKWFIQSTLRTMMTEDGFRERLVRFWADHFTVEGKQGVLRNSVSTYVEEAIRPNLTGSFGQLMTAAVTHPMMLIYLDQFRSVGPSSEIALKKGRGLNENLSREVLELHSLGVGAGYTQKDVTELAKLFAGMSFSREDGFVFRANMAEPGAETVLGKSYGGDRADFRDIETFLNDLALKPQTAQHIAWKLARHFVSDTPPVGLVAAIARAFQDSGGDLMALYEALLTHDAAWTQQDQKVKLPYGFMSSALRALEVSPDRLTALNFKDTRLYLGTPLRVMGQDWQNPTGPDGWPEEESHWITPQGIAGRIQWAMTVPRVLRPDLPDPRAFLPAALGVRATDALRFAANGAATKWEGIGLILSSPVFQRR